VTDIAKMIQAEIDKAIEEAMAEESNDVVDVDDPREYHFIVNYVQGKGWVVDTAQLVQKYPSGAIWDPENEEWQRETDYVSNYSRILSELLTRLED